MTLWKLVLAVVITTYHHPVWGLQTEQGEDMPLFSYTFPSHVNHFSPLSSSLLDSVREVAAGLAITPQLDDEWSEAAFNNVTFNTTQCARDMKQLLVDMKAKKRYALEVWDSFAKIESGLLLGKIRWLGMYDECVRAGGDDVAFQGLYCRAAITTPKLGNLTVELGVCFSDVCSNEEVAGLVNLMYSGVPMNVASANCQRTRPWSAGDIVALTITCLLALLSLVGSTIDLTRQTVGHVKKRNLRKAEMREMDTQSELSTFVAVLESESPADVEPGLSIGGITQFCSVQSADEIAEEIEAQRQHLKAQQRSFKLFGWKRTAVDILLCWSWVTNGAKLLKPAPKTGSNMAVINGIRTLSIWTVVLGHTIYFFGKTISNPVELVNLMGRFSSQVILSAPLSVDTFFFLSGLLVTYSVLREMAKRKGRMAWPLYYFHRIWRLTPAYMFVLIFYCTVFLHMVSGPFSNNFDDLKSMTNCHTLWWTNLLYINNLYPGTMTEQCLGWSWYLSNDMQFYVISPLFLILLYRNWQIGLSVLAVVGAASMTLVGSIAYHYNFSPVNFRDGAGSEGASDLYVQPWYRISPYIVGIITGWILVRFKGKIHLQKRYVTLCWCMCTVVMVSIVYGLYYYYHNLVPMDRALAAFYTGMYRGSWALGIAWIILACLSGYGGPVNRLLSWSLWSTLGRLTYCAYLVHPMVMQMSYLSTKNLIYVDDFNIVYLFLAHLVMTYMVAFATSMMVEAPMMGLEKIFFRKPTKAPRKPTRSAEMTATTSGAQNDPVQGHNGYIPHAEGYVKHAEGPGEVNVAFESDEIQTRPRAESTA